MNLKNILEVNTAEIVEDVLQIKLQGMANTYYAYSLTYNKSYLVVVNKDGNIIDVKVILLDPEEEKYIRSIIDGLL